MPTPEERILNVIVSAVKKKQSPEQIMDLLLKGTVAELPPDIMITTLMSGLTPEQKDALASKVEAIKPASGLRRFL